MNKDNPIQLPEVTVRPGFRFDFEKGKKALFPNGYTNKQEEAVSAIIGESNTQGVKLATQVAYMLATAYHEAYDWNKPNSRMTCLVEMGGQSYLKNKAYYPWYGRGFSHLTWKKNYIKESERMGIDLIAHPEKLFEISIAANSHVYCMMNGTYTSVPLTRFVHSGKTDFPNARKVVNGTDKAEVIAGYAMEFLKCIIQ
jgi:hypothetical protein